MAIWLLPIAALVCFMEGWAIVGWILLAAFACVLIGIQVYVGSLDERSARRRAAEGAAWRKRVTSAKRARAARADGARRRTDTKGRVPEAPSREARLGRALGDWPPGAG